MEVNNNGGSPSFYSVLGVSSDSSIDEIRRAYRKLAMQWHPDRWTRTPSLLGQAKRKFQQIREAYSVLSDQKKRALYDVGMFDPDDDDDENEGFYDFMQEMLSLMSTVKREEKDYSIKELQGMLNEMIKDFDSPPPSPSPSWYCKPSVLDESGRAKRGRWDHENSTMTSSVHHVPFLYQV